MNLKNSGDSTGFEPMTSAMPVHITFLSYMKGMLYAVRCLKSNEDMILALAGQFKQLSHEPENSGDSTGFEPMTSAMPVHIT